ncbi:MAG: O-antigen ligase family protein [Pseudomonadota bacterium]
MSVAGSYANSQPAGLERSGGLNASLITNFFIGLAVFLGGFVLFEPAPYELLMAGMMGMGFIAGMRIPLAIFPLLIPVATFSIGGLISAFMIDDYQRGVIYVAVTLFLGLTSVFFAVMIANDMRRLRLIFRLYVIAAAVTSLLGIFGYFGAPGMEIFTRYNRAQGAFADPNVFAPFLIPPILYLMYGVMNRSITKMPIRLGFLIILLAGDFLAFSRAAWGLTLLTGGLFYILLLINEPKAQARAKYILLGVLGLAGLIVGLLGALQVDAVSSIFSERAQVVQSYDGARLGRFARHLIGFELAASNPLGIGNLEFGQIYGEDEHNVYLRSLLSYGWLGFVSWLVMVLWPIIVGFKMLFLQRPWLVYFQIAYVVFFGHLLVGWVIDIDHWRHVYLLLGILWGCIMLEQKHRKGGELRELHK